MIQTPSYILCSPLAWGIGKVYYNDFDLQVIFGRDRSFKNICQIIYERKTLFWITVLDFYWC